MLHAVIMAGGSGTRFWPMSRRSRPKHLLNLLGPASLLQQTVARIAPSVPADRILVVTGADQAAEVRTQLPELSARSIIAEPCRRDTAPCIGLAATLLLQDDPDAVMMVLPADHVITPVEEFQKTIAAAAALVENDPARLVTLGIKPVRPATGYGYIQRGAAISCAEGTRAFQVQRFREKPDLETATKYLVTGEFYWNSGVFVWSARTILEEIGRQHGAMISALERIRRAWHSPQAETSFADEYASIQPISIDYAVLEAARNVVVIESEFRWDDVGSWGAVQRLATSETDGNTIHGLHCGIDTKASIVLGESDHLIATIGVENLIIVQCGKATLVADKRREESVKQLVELLRQRELDEYL